MNKNQETQRFTLYTRLLNGVVTVAALVIIAFIIMKPNRLTDPNWVIWFLVIIGGMHTFEEYTFPGGFVCWLNAVFFSNHDADFPLSAKRAFFTDAMAGVVIMTLLAVIGINHLWLSLGIACIFFINGCWHLTSTITSGSYSPGAVSSALFNLPLGLYIIYFYFSKGYASLADISIAYGIGLIVHIIFFAVLRRDMKQQPEQTKLASA